MRMRMSRVQGLLLAGLVLAGSAEASLAAETPKALVGQVVSVVDGDTIKVRMGDRVETVRYIGMNAPELHHPEKGEEPGGREATEANRKLVEGQTVRLELDVQERDRYGRLLAYVYLGDMMVNAEMVAQGYGQAMTIPPNVRHQELFLKLQREARLLQIGLWRGTGPAPPEPGARSPAAGSPPTQTAQSRPGAPPQDAYSCPLSHPIKGNFTTYSGERCIYHVPGGQFYGRTKPERCYTTDGEAVKDGCRRSRR
jgi:micrococcal nuclease